MRSEAQPAEPSEVQGALFATHIVHSGVPDPELATTSVHLEPAPTGHYPEQETALETTGEIENPVVKAVHQAVGTDNRRKAQLGKHSSLERSGSYVEGLQVGDYLPNFGPVTYRNLSQAREHAASLEAKRKSRQ